MRVFSERFCFSISAEKAVRLFLLVVRRVAFLGFRLELDTNANI